MMSTSFRPTPPAHKSHCPLKQTALLAGGVLLLILMISAMILRMSSSDQVPLYHQGKESECILNPAPFQSSWGVRPPIPVVIPHLHRGDRVVNTHAWCTAGFLPHVYVFAESTMQVGGSIFPRSLAGRKGGGLYKMSRSKFLQYQQLMDFLSMLRHFTSTAFCGENFILISDDDTTPCDGAGHHVYAAIRQLADWLGDERQLAIRFSIGTNGILLRCFNVQGLISFVDAYLQSKAPEYAVDTLIDLWADETMFVYKSNLIQHLDSPSNIWSEVETTRRDDFVPPCSAPILWSGRSFDVLGCSGSQFTPCLFNASGRQPEGSPAASAEMEKETAMFYIDRLGIHLATQGFSCAKSCRHRGEKCVANFLPWANRCSVLMALNPLCQKCIAANGRELPSVATTLTGPNVSFTCYVQATPGRTTCDARWDAASRACVCRPKIRGEPDDPDEGEETIKKTAAFLSKLILWFRAVLQT